MMPIRGHGETPAELEAKLEAARHTIAVQELEKKAYKLKARALALKVARLEKLYKEARQSQKLTGGAA